MMQRLLFLLFPIFLCTSFTKAQDFWEIVPTPDTANIISMTIHNNGDIWLGDNGVYLSQDNGETWQSKGLSNNIIYSIVTDSLDNIFAGSSRKIFKSNNYGDSWYLVYSGADNIISFACNKNGMIYAGSGYEIGVLRSFNYGDTWDTSFMVPGWWEYIKDISISNQGTVYIGATAYAGNGGGVYRSVDAGNNWEHIGLYEEAIKSIEFDSNNDLYVGSCGPNWGVYKKDINDDWELLFNNGTVTGIAIDSSNNIYISCSYEIFVGGAYYSDDLGETWTPIKTGLISNDLDKLEISPNQYLFSICYNWNTLYRSSLPTVSIPKTKLDNFVRVLPNPFSETLIFDTNMLPEIYENSVLNIYSCEGRLHFNEQLRANEGQNLIVNTSTWKPGIYFYQIKHNNQTYTGKIIKAQAH